jgi:large subunit ribosomal protein L25
MEIMEKAVLKASHRNVIGKKVGALRRQGKLPGVLYGHHIDPTPIEMDLREATRYLSALSGSALVQIEVDGKPYSALVREKQRDFIRGTYLHVDFQAVSLTEKLRTSVAVELTGLSPAVKDFNGFVVNGLNDLEVECFPQDLPESIIVDISNLAKIGDGIYVRDIVLSEKVVLLDNPDEMIALVTFAGKEEEEEVVEAPTLEEPEVIERGKKEEEEGEESKA